MIKLQQRTARRRYRYDDLQASPVDLSTALATDLADNAIDRAVREATRVPFGPVPGPALAAIRELRISGHRLSDLSPLAQLTGLERLWVRSHAVHDLRPLSGLTRLRELVICDAPVIDLAPLRKLTRLERLRVENVPLTDLQPISALKRLEDLCLRGTLVDDLSPLARLKQLRELELTDGLPLADLAVLLLLPRLRYVNLAGTRVEQMRGVPARLREVHFDGIDGEPQLRVVADAAPALDAQARVATLTEALLGVPCEVRGLVERRGVRLPFPANPWNLPARTDATRAVERLWAPLRRRAPHVAGRLPRLVSALALVQRAGDDEPLLAYLVDRPHAEPALVLGRPPDEAPVTDGGFRIPVGLRELYTVHAGLRSTGAELLPPAALRSLAPALRRRLDQFRARNCGLHPDQFRLFFTDGDGGEVLDLDRLDARQDPLVRRWYPQTAEIDGAAPFWDWFEDHAPALFFE